MKTMKKMQFLASMAAVAMMAVGFTACNNDDNNDGDGTANVVVDGVLPSKVTTNLTLEKDTYTLNGRLLVEAGGVLEIEAGTKIKAAPGFGSYILVLKGGKIKVMGTAAEPVVMTAEEEGNAYPGYWGGLIINGNAKISGSDNATPKVGSTEISSSFKYGGNNNADNSGEIHFLVLEYTGARSGADVEHNGLTLNAVGNGTHINDVFVIDGADDGIEFFGGSVNVENLLVVNSDDDMFDFTMGYSGELKNAYGIWEAGYSTTEADPRGIEADGNHDGLYPSDTPQSNFKVTNVTFDLRVPYLDKAAEGYQTKSMDDVIKLRRRAKATITNALVKGVTHVEDLVDLTDNVKLPGDTEATPQNADLASIIEIRSQLTTAADRALNPNDGTYTQVNVENSTNTGCATSVFGWTGYTF